MSVFSFLAYIANREDRQVLTVKIVDHSCATPLAPARNGPSYLAHATSIGNDDAHFRVKPEEVD